MKRKNCKSGEDCSRRKEEQPQSEKISRSAAAFGCSCSADTDQKFGTAFMLLLPALPCLFPLILLLL